jgi:hypothetical protein
MEEKKRHKDLKKRLNDALPDGHPMKKESQI